MLRKRLAEVMAIKKGVLYLRRVRHEIICLISDLWHLPRLVQMSRQESVKNSEYAFIVSLDFYYKKRWQVVSQKDLWYSFVDDKSPIFCGSILSYYLLGRDKKFIMCLEPGWNAPSVKFGSHHDKCVLFLSDSHSKDWLPGYLKGNNITDIITPYKKTLISTGYAECLGGDRVHSFPWAVSDDVVNKGNIETRNTGVLSFGKTGGEVYDLREWSFNTGLLKTYDYAGSGNQRYKNGDYFYWLRTYDACVVAMSTKDLYNYTVAKYFEVPSQGVLLIAFPTVDMEDFGFIDGENCVFVTKTTFEGIIRDFEANPVKYESARIKGRDLIAAHHTVSRRLEHLDEIFMAE